MKRFVVKIVGIILFLTVSCSIHAQLGITGGINRSSLINGNTGIRWNNYYKTGFQSDLKNVYEANYKICDRKNILELIERHINNTKNNILIDYYEHIKSLDDEVSLFYTLPVGEWGWSQINGFYDYCQKNLVDKSHLHSYIFQAVQLK